MANTIDFGKRYEDDYSYFESPLRFHFAEVHQVGELFCEAGFRIDSHRQRVFEITYVVTGRGTVYADDKAYEVEENDVFVNVIGQNHEIRADRGTPLRFCYLGFTFLGHPFGAPDIERFYRSIKGDRVIRDKALLTLFSRIFDEMQQKNEFYMMMVGAYVEQIIVQVQRGLSRSRVGAASADAETRIGNAAYTVVRYVDQHYRDIGDIRELAASLGYSYTYLAHIFKAKTGMTIGSYIIMKKMEEAKWLLRSGRMNVSQIASRFNYMSVQSFSNSFKKNVGISPADYQALSPEEAAAYDQ